MFTRSLVTPFPTDDVQLDLASPANTYPFGVAVLDNAMGTMQTMNGQDCSNSYTLGGAGSGADLTAINETPSAPVIGGTGFTGAPITTVPNNPTTVAAVTIYAAFDAENVYMLMVWTDVSGTESDQKQRWDFDGTTWTRSASSANDEDRIAIFWRVDSTVPGFDSGGCDVLCNGSRMGTMQLDDHMDLWHWKAARTNPLGFADDQRLANGVWGPVLSGRSDDTGTGTAVANTDGGVPELPRLMAVGDPGTGAKFLVAAPDGAGVTVPFANTGFAAGARIPGYTLRGPTGGRADILAVGEFSAGQWAVMMTRSLSTPFTTDDAQFDLANPASTIPFGVAVLDNQMGSGSTMVGQDANNAYTLGGPGSGADLIATNETPSEPVVGGTGFTGASLTTAPIDPATVAAVTLRAAFDAENVYILAIWTDVSATESDQKQRWEFDGVAWTRTPSSVNDEDRLAIWWRVDATVPQFDIGGCSVLCNGARMGTMQLDDHMDLWHWKAGRTNPAGFAGDQRLANGVWGPVLSGRSDDTGTGVASSNSDAGAPELPISMSTNDPGADARFLFALPSGAFPGIAFDPFSSTPINPPVGPTLSFAVDVNPIIQGNCPCHLGGASQNGFNMDTYANVIAGGNSNPTNPEVIPGDGANSLLYQKVSMASPPVGQQMPLGGPFLSVADQLKIKDWIDQGALNN